MIVETLSVFPEMFEQVMSTSILGRARRNGILDFHAHDLRDWTHDRHRTTDDEPYGGGAGLVMKCEPIFEAYRDLVSPAAVEACEDSATRRFAAQDPSDPSCAPLLQSDEYIDGVQTVAPSSAAPTAGAREGSRQGELLEAGAPSGGTVSPVEDGEARPLRIAVPKGALNPGTIEVLAAAGLDVTGLDDPGRQLIISNPGSTTSSCGPLTRRCSSSWVQPIAASAAKTRCSRRTPR